MSSFYLSSSTSLSTEIGKKLQELASAVKISWYHDCDKTKEMKEIIQILKKMAKANSLEEFFDNSKEDLEYFMGDFMKEVIDNILCQPFVYGDNGDEVAANLLFHIINLFQSFHNKSEYGPLWEKMRSILQQDRSASTFFRPNNSGYHSKIYNEKKFFSAKKFNEIFNKEFEKEMENKEEFKLNDIIDIAIKNPHARNNFDSSCWVRGKIVGISNNNEEWETSEEKRLSIDAGDALLKLSDVEESSVFPAGTKTKDWDWRQNLQEGDFIDCYDRNRWFPATVVGRRERESENGMKEIN